MASNNAGSGGVKRSATPVTGVDKKRAKLRNARTILVQHTDSGK